MKLFAQLTETDQNNVIHHCADIVIQDMLTDGIKLEPISEEDLDLQAKLEAAIQHVKQFATDDEKAEYLLADPFVSKAVYDIATSMAHGAFYHDLSELVIYPEALKDDQENDIGLLLPEVNTVKKSDNSLN